MPQKPVTGRKRFFKLAGMTASVAGNYAKTKLKSTFLGKEAATEAHKAAHGINGQRIAQTLGELKGAVMKVGQMASVTSDLFPKEIAAALGTLQQNAPPMAYETIRAQVETELGAPIESLYRWFDDQPFAAASIGQVHRARTNEGQEVVVKVQYPGVDGAVDSDLRHLKVALVATGLLKVKRAIVDEVLNEVRERLREELDYLQEAKNVCFFGDYYRDNVHVVVPEVIADRTSQRVLTLTYEPSDPWQNTDRTIYNQTMRDEIGRHLFELLADQLFSLQVIHADPNPANMGIRRDGSIVLYDFGCVKHLKPTVVSAYKQAVRASLAEDYSGVEQALIALGARNLDGPQVPESLYRKWREILARPFLGDQPYDYGSARVHRDVIRNTPDLIPYINSFQPRGDFVFIDRLIAGHYGNLVQIGCRGAFRHILMAHVSA